MKRKLLSSKPFGAKPHTQIYFVIFHREHISPGFVFVASFFEKALRRMS